MQFYGKERIMAKFERTDKMIQNMTMDSFGGNVEMDVEVVIRYSGSKLKAYAPALNCYLQFPKKIREFNKRFICDCTEATNNGRTFYRFYKGTIRDETGEVVG
jgi:hypothetical protein